MSFNAYPQYHDSGAAWLGDVPVGWRVVPAKSIFAERKRLSYPDDTHLTPSQKHGVMAQADYMALTGNKVVLNLSGSDSMRHVEPRDFISHLRSFQGGLELSRLRGKVSAAYTVLTPGSGVVTSYFRYVFKSKMYVQALQTTTDQLRDGQSIRYGQFALIPLVVPPAEVQQQIAGYLDTHTVQIDVLIEKQELLIETLAERRQAIVSHAVTKGLHANVEMKASGVQWLGAIPEAWPAGHLRWFAGSASGKSVDTELEADALHPYPAMGGNGVMGYAAATNTSPGTLVVGRVGALCGNVHPILEPSWVTDNALYLVPGERFNPRYLLQLLRARRLNEIASKTAQPLITGTQLLDQTVPLPTLREQDEIVEHLDRETAQIDALSEKAREMIDVLKERRQALISAAVTGKIDVRGLS